MDLFLEILGTLVGIAYLYYEYRADMRVWIAGIIMPAISLFVYWKAGLYADFGINIYYLLAAIYGWCVWKYGHRQEVAERPIRRMPLRMLPILALTFAACFLAIGWILEKYTDSNVPWWDSFTTALSIVGMWMLARKWLEQWLAWIVVDVVCSGLYAYKEVYFYAALYAIYVVVAVLGYREWKRKMNEKQESCTM